MCNFEKQIILASNSPRRREMLRQIGLSFVVAPADVDESILPGEEPGSYAIRVACDKARVAAERAGKGLVVAADTIVVSGGMILGKPVDSADAERMLRILSNKKHSVITGFAVLDAETGRIVSGKAVTNVWFRELPDSEIRAYVATGEPLDKAGAYGIQEKGALMVEKIEGCYFNVVGLPLSMLGAVLRDFGVPLEG